MNTWSWEDTLWERRVPGAIADGTIPTHFISAADLLANKLATGRLQDLADAEELQRALQAEAVLRTKEQEEP